MISKERLVELLNQLPDGAIVLPNRVGNLAYYVDTKYAGYIDLQEEEVCPY